MSRQVPCTRHDQAGTADPLLREVLADASTRTRGDLSVLLLSLYMHEGELLATWKNDEGRKAGAPSLTEAWHAKVGPRRILNLVPTDFDYDYQEEVMDNAFHD